MGAKLVAERLVQVRKKLTSTPACWKKTTQKSDKGKHRSQKYEITHGRGAKSHNVICWACANPKEKQAIKRARGGPKDF